MVELKQLEMVWPQSRLTMVPKLIVPSGYRLRTYESGDEARFYEVMVLSG